MTTREEPPRVRIALTLAVSVGVAACSTWLEHVPGASPDEEASVSESMAGDAGREPRPPPLKLAFLGDQGVNPNARAVLELVASERADALVHLGDFAYSDAPPSGWNAQLDSVLGPDFPVFAAIGNHDTSLWEGDDGFRAYLLARLQRSDDAHCRGEYGVHASCTFRGVTLVLSGIGTYGADHELFLESALHASNTPFRLCIWHKNQHDLQVGAKGDEVGWLAYRVCALHGAPVINGHEHSYARSFLLTSIGDYERAHGSWGPPADLELQPGSTFVAVAGLGGKSSRVFTPEHETDTWWASIYARDYQLQNAVLMGTENSIQYGALFIEFGVRGDPRQAHGYFKTVDGSLRDDFEVRAP